MKIADIYIYKNGEKNNIKKGEIIDNSPILFAKHQI